jgi:hypothetical protein
MQRNSTYTQFPFTNHELTPMIDFIQEQIATSSEAQRQSVRLLMRWWLEAGRHLTPESEHPVHTQ